MSPRQVRWRDWPPPGDTVLYSAPRQPNAAVRAVPSPFRNPMLGKLCVVQGVI